MKKRLIVTPQICIGCRSCEIACSFVHAESMSRPAMSRVRVYPFSQDSFVPVLCLQCEEAACAKVCPTEALVRNKETGAIDFIADRCVQCKTCVAACPFGNIHFDATANSIIKCDECHGDPACARFCPTGALVWAETPPRITGKEKQAQPQPPQAIAMLAGRK